MTDRPTNFPGVLSDREADSGALHSASETPGKAKRKAIPAHVKVSVAIRQANSLADERFYLKRGMFCPLCGKILLSNESRILEHMVPHSTMTALGKDPDAIDNLAWVHAECADRKTNGTKATTAGSDKHMIAKGNRFDRVNAGQRSRKRKGKPLTHPTLKRTFGGKVVSRG